MPGRGKTAYAGTVAQAGVGYDGWQRTTTRIRRFKLECYGVFLVCLILAYYVLTFYLGVELLQHSWLSLFGQRASSALWGLVTTFGGLVALALGARLLIHCVYGVFGLLTAQNDNAGAQPDGVELAKADCPDLFQEVAEVGARLGTVLPDVIWLVSRPECYALELRRFGIRPRRRLVLALGLPHFEVLTIAELKVIIAHELAHFISDTRMAVLVYRFLYSLQAGEDTEGRRWLRLVDPAMWLMQGYAWFFRLLAAPFLRWQEIQADRLSAAAYGGELASWTLLKVWLLDRQFEAAVTAFELDREQRDNFYRHFARTWREFSPAAYQYLYNRLGEEEVTSRWDSHPPTSQRIAQMGEFKHQPNIELSLPAWQLLPDLSTLEDTLDGELRADLVATFERVHCHLRGRGLVPSRECV